MPTYLITNRGPAGRTPSAAESAYLTDPARYVQSMGSEALLAPVPGGQYRVRMADGFAAAGAFVEVEPPRRLVFLARLSIRAAGGDPGPGPHSEPGPEPGQERRDG